MVQRKNSSDLDTGRRPKLKSDEFFLWTPLVIEMWRYEDLFTIEKMLHLFGASLPGAVLCESRGGGGGARGPPVYAKRDT